MLSLNPTRKHWRPWPPEELLYHRFSWVWIEEFLLQLCPHRVPKELQWCHLLVMEPAQKSGKERDGDGVHICISISQAGWAARVPTPLHLDITSPHTETPKATFQWEKRVIAMRGFTFCPFLEILTHTLVTMLPSDTRKKTESSPGTTKKTK